MSMKGVEISISFKSIVREVRDGIGSMSLRAGCGGGGVESVEESSPVRPRLLRRPEGRTYQGRWADLPPELLNDIMKRVEEDGAAWPGRAGVVACASVCRSWREAILEIVCTPELCGKITFPISLKQPGPREAPIQCFIRRERATGLFCLYLGLGPAQHGENGKLLLAARRTRRAASTDYLISLVSDDFSRASSTYLGKLRANLLGTKFTIYDSQPPCNATALSNCLSSRRIHSRKVSPRVPAGNYSIGTISYELNLLRTRGPRRMQCILHSIPASAVHDGGTAPTPTSFLQSLDEDFSVSHVVKQKDPPEDFSSTSLTELLPTTGDPLVLKNKAPRWHEQLQCWCLNFRGRVTVASVKNFQLVAAVDPTDPVSQAEQDRVILQFGKIGKDIFTMDYRYPLSAFQAFTICLSSFDTKPVCE